MHKNLIKERNFMKSCGDASNRSGVPNIAGPDSPNDPNSDSNGDGNSDDGTDATNDPSTLASNFDPAYTFSFDLKGSSGEQSIFKTPEINTDSILKISIQPISNYSSAAGNYGCAQFTVTVNGQSVSTKLLSVSGVNSFICLNNPDVQIIDFSTRVGSPGPVIVEVSKARYDYWCQLWMAGTPGLYGTQSMYCPVRPVYEQHTVSGTIAIQVNGS